MIRGIKMPFDTMPHMFFIIYIHKDIYAGQNDTMYFTLNVQNCILQEKNSDLKCYCLLIENCWSEIVDRRVKQCIC